MHIEWLGHASFLITTRAGKKILTDPYTAGSYGGAVGYGKIDIPVDVVTVSHAHDDHCGVTDLKGSPEVINESEGRTTTGLCFEGIRTYHDGQHGTERGENIIFVIEAEGMRICHLGDLGHPLDDTTVSRIGKVDVLLIPVGGVYTIDADQATHVVAALNPRVVIPMHYKTEVLGFPIDGVERFLKGKEGIKRVGRSGIEIEKDALPKEREIIVLEHAL
jgi:L-ascorbate metabolism protein UlaG (beta-lactamase superfamily)